MPQFRCSCRPASYRSRPLPPPPRRRHEFPPPSSTVVLLPPRPESVPTLLDVDALVLGILAPLLPTCGAALQGVELFELSPPLRLPGRRQTGSGGPRAVAASRRISSFAARHYCRRPQ